MAPQAQMVKGLIQEFKLKGTYEHSKEPQVTKTKTLTSSDDDFKISLDDESFGKY